MLGKVISKAQPLKSRSYLPFNFPIAKIRFGIRLAAEGKEWAAHSFNYALVWVVLKYQFH